jgi:hypothetical protein
MLRGEGGGGVANFFSKHSEVRRRVKRTALQAAGAHHRVIFSLKYVKYVAVVMEEVTLVPWAQ